VHRHEPVQKQINTVGEERIELSNGHQTPA